LSFRWSGWSLNELGFWICFLFFSCGFFLCFYSLFFHFEYPTSPGELSHGVVGEHSTCCGDSAAAQPARPESITDFSLCSHCTTAAQVFVLAMYVYGHLIWCGCAGGIHQIFNLFCMQPENYVCVQESTSTMIKSRIT
jgi:hypothetical protein